MMTGYIHVLRHQIQRLKSVGLDRKDLINVLNDTMSIFPFVEQIHEKIAISAGRQLVKASPIAIDNASLTKQKETYIEILEKAEIYIIQNGFQYLPLKVDAMNILYINPPQFSSNYVLHEKNKNKLTVSGLLSAIGYVQKTLGAMGVKIDEKYSMTLTVFNSIELAVNNKNQDKPFNKALHIANDVLTELANKAVEDELAGRVISGTSLAIDLAIDFLIKE